MSTITFTGNLADNPQLRFTTTGVPVAELVVIENRRRRDDAGEWVDDEPNRFRVKAWRQTAENIAESLTKGASVTVTGWIKTERWEDKDTGENRYAQHVEADEVSVPLRWQSVTITKIAKRQQISEADPTE